MPVAVAYVPKAGKTGEAMAKHITRDIKLIQTCQMCLGKSEIEEHILVSTQCDSFCKDCWEHHQVCENCTDLGYTKWQPPLRPCIQCKYAGKQCVKTAVFVYVTDCEEGNKKALEMLALDVDNHRQDPALACCSFIPDAVHVGKSPSVPSVTGSSF